MVFWFGSYNQSTRSRCLHYFPAAILEPPTWRLDTRLYNFAQNINISMEISALGQRTHLILGEPSSLFIVYNITISWLCPPQCFLFCFQLRDNEHTLFNNQTTSPSFLRADSQRGAAELTIARRKRGRVVELFQYKFTVVSLRKKKKMSSNAQKRTVLLCYMRFKP